MPFARSQLDIICCRSDPDKPIARSDFDDLTKRWKGLVHTEIVTEGFQRLYFDHQVHPVLYANHQGGYRAFCHACNHNVAGSFSKAVSKWRSGSERTFECPACLASYPLEDVRLMPDGAIATGAIVFSGVESITLTSRVESDLQDILGNFKLIYKRIG